MLWVDDLCQLYLSAINNIELVSGQAYNIGGGAPNARSVQDVLRTLERLYGTSLPAAHGPWRSGDQRIFVADTARITNDLGWAPRMGADEGIARLVEWIRHSLPEIERGLETPT